ncbi:MAG: ATP-binding protein [Spirochaetaceae bacterium]|nr:ATP-binding protein [Spirochaetaceae bacterium]
MKINPFEPFAPVNPGSFVGRLVDLRRLKAALIQTSAGKPVNFMITGERGIGKTSLLNYLKYAAEGHIPIDGEKLSFVVIDTDINEHTTPLGLISKIQLGLENALGQHEAGRDLLKKAWSFLQRVEAGGIKIGNAQKTSDELLLDEFAYSLAATTARICSDSGDTTLWNTKTDGVLVLIDEADNGGKSLQLGSFFKLLGERLQRRGCARVMFGLAGLPELRKVLHDSHPSSLRMFDEIALNRLQESEINTVVDICLEEANTQNPKPTAIAEDGRNLLVSLSEGYPHFIQQFGYSSFAADTDDLIDSKDVLVGAFGERGALAQIGDNYYRNDFYNKIQKESYRKVLRIMAEYRTEWVPKQDIRNKFNGSDSVLNNAIKALRDRKIIRSKEGQTGIYRLQHRGFALWIRYYTVDPESLLSDGARDTEVTR